MLNYKEKAALLEHLLSFISSNKKEKFEEHIQYRTKYLTVILEDIYQAHNASAVLRSCDCFGIQDIHIIENQNPYTLNPDVALGSSKWTNLIKYTKQDNNTLSCINTLKKQGYARVRVDGQIHDLSDEIQLDKNKNNRYYQKLWHRIAHKSETEAYHPCASDVLPSPP